MRFLRQNTAAIITVGPFYDKTDGVTIETALTITNERITLISDTDGGSAPTIILDNITGATAATANDLNYITNNDAGLMQLELSAANVDRLGRIFLTITDAANHCPVWHEFFILPQAIYDWLIGTIVPLPSNVTQWLGTAAATPTVAGVPEVDMTHLVGVAQSATDLKNFADEGYDPVTNNIIEVVTVAGNVEGNVEGTVNSVIGSVGSVVGSVQTVVDPVSVETVLSGSISTDAITALARTQIRSLVSGTSDSGTTTTMVDAARTEADIDYFKGCFIFFTSGTILGQCRLITEFDPATNTITFAPATTQTVGTQTYEILPSGQVDVGAIGDGTISAASLAADTDAYTTRTWIAKQGTSNDKYIIQWVRNGQVLVSGVTLPKIRVFDEAGTDLIAETAMTEIGSTQSFKFEEAIAKLVPGEIYMVEAKATIDGSVRLDRQPVMRDSA